MLAELFDRHGSDKEWYHHYSEHYEALLEPRRHEIAAVLELGVFEGASVKAWADYFPNAVVYGIDLKVPTIDHERIKLFPGDATDPLLLDLVTAHARGDVTYSERHTEGFDLIVDDASHAIEDQLRSLLELWPALAPKGLYVIEDHVDPAHLFTLRHLPGAEVLAYDATHRGSLVVVRK